MKMNGLRNAQILVPNIDFIKCSADRKLARDHINLVTKPDCRHLPSGHDFLNHQRKIERKNQQSQSRTLITSIISLFKFEFKVINVGIWILKNSISTQPKNKIEATLIKGLGFQHLNSNVQFEEVFESIPSEIFSLKNRTDIHPILVHDSALDLPESVSSAKSVYTALLMILTPVISKFSKFLVQAQLIFILALFDSSLRKLLNEIPEALLLINFKTKFEYFSIIDTQGSFANLDLLYYSSHLPSDIRTTIIHYSESGMPIMANQECINEIIPSYERAPVTTQIVWTKEFAEFYNARGPKKNFIALGPQVFREKKVVPSQEKSDGIVLGIFDETPIFSDEFYYHLREEAGIKFLFAIEQIRKEFNSNNNKKLTIYFKQKRRNLELHSRTYLELLKNMTTQRLITILPWDTNPYLMVSNSDLVLTVLGSSPALIGRHLQRPTAYGYFGDGNILQPIIDYKIPVLRNTNQLSVWLNSYYRDSKKLYKNASV